MTLSDADSNIVTAVDATFASPYNIRPLELGMDVVVHSCTKYLGGHSDLMAGCVSVARDDLAKEFWQTTKLFGPVASPFDAYLLLRGIKTLEVRMERHNANAQAVATFLESHPAVVTVHYPGLPSHPHHDLCKRQLKGGGGMVAFDMGSLAAAQKLIESLSVINLAVSLGGVESLVEHAASMTHTMVPREDRLAAGITDGLIRLSVGLESAEDLIQDLDQALSEC